jgi:hypothetical protein
MSEVKVGDRVRVVIEADVLEASNFDGDGIMLEAWNYVPPVGVCGVVSIEVIEPPFVLPTKRWAQVVDDAGMLWTREYLDNDDHREWISINGGTHRNSEDMLGGWAKLPLRVISEGVDE